MILNRHWWKIYCSQFFSSLESIFWKEEKTVFLVNRRNSYLVCIKLSIVTHLLFPLLQSFGKPSYSNSNFYYFLHVKPLNSHVMILKSWRHAPLNQSEAEKEKQTSQQTKTTRTNYSNVPLPAGDNHLLRQLIKR